MPQPTRPVSKRHKADEDAVVQAPTQPSVLQAQAPKIDDFEDTVELEVEKMLQKGNKSRDKKQPNELEMMIQ